MGGGATWPPATYDVISRNHSNWPSLNLSQNVLEEWTNSYWKCQVLMSYPLEKNSQKPHRRWHPPYSSSYKNKLGVQQPIEIKKKKKSANKFDAELCQTFYNLELQFPWEVTKHIIGDELVYRQISPGDFRTTNFLSTV